MQILLASLGGIIPIIIWLWFWLKEDSKNPEPKKYIFTTFIAGMLSALFVIFIEKYIIENTINYSLLSLLLLSSTEEIFKFIFAYFSALKRKFMNEPIDAFIYMVTIALGFAAMENILYLKEIFSTEILSKSIILMNMRFIGAAVLHTASSGIIGVMIGLSFYKKRSLKRIYLFIGLILSIGLHTAFNFFIMNNNRGSIFNVFIYVWVIIIILILVIEKIKRLKNTKQIKLN